MINKHFIHRLPLVARTFYLGQIKGQQNHLFSSKLEIGIIYLKLSELLILIWDYTIFFSRITNQK